jgi:hypothetical protein
MWAAPGRRGSARLAWLAASGGPTTATLDPTTDFGAGEVCTLTVVAAEVSDQDSADPPDNRAADNVFDFTTRVRPTCDS